MFFFTREFNDPKLCMLCALLYLINLVGNDVLIFNGELSVL